MRRLDRSGEAVVTLRSAGVIGLLPVFAVLTHVQACKEMSASCGCRVRHLMKNFSTSEVLRLVAGFDASSFDFPRRIKSLLGGLVAIGFHSARFYLKVENATENRQEVIRIISYEYRDAPPPTILETKILLSETTILRNGDLKKGYSIGTSRDHEDVTWPADLHLTDGYWIDLLISNPHTEEIYGLLAIAWSGSRDLLNEDSIAALRLIAARVTSWITQRSAHIMQEREALERKGFEVDEETGSLTHGSVESVLRFLQQSFGSDAVAIFEYDCLIGNVTKIDELFLNSGARPRDMMEETYEVGKFLTGKAFSKSEFCFIPDFEDFDGGDSTNINQDSIKYHRQQIGGIRSCLYGHIGFGRRRYLVRLFRSIGSEMGIFSKKDRDDLRYACRQLSYRLERELREFQQTRMRAATTEAFWRLRSTDETKDALIQYLIASKFGPFLLATKSEGDGVPDIEYSHGFFDDYRANMNWEESNLAELLSKSRHLGSAHRVKFSGPHHLLRRSSPIPEPWDGRYDEVLLIGTRSMQATTTLVLPRNSRSGPAGDDQMGLSKNEEGFLISLLSIYAAAAEAKKSLITAEKADHMLADLGHEVGTPVSILTQTAIFACDRSLEAIASLGRIRNQDAEHGRASDVEDLGLLAEELEALKLEVNGLGGLVQIVTEIPRTLAQLGNGHLQMDFQVHRWAELIEDIWKDALDWANILSERELGIGRVSKGAFVLRTSDNFGNRMLVGDRNLLRIAVGNVVKNALKYSLPRHRNAPMEIGIFLEPQAAGGKVFLNVRNWGVGVPPESFRRIFGKYERIVRRDRVRTIRGRGIGLFLAQYFIRAHGGDIVCRSSVPTLDDVFRTQDLEGYETTFRLWLPATAEVGKRTATI